MTIAGWTCVLELAALRRDSSAFASVNLSVPPLGRAAVVGLAAQRAAHDRFAYFARFFDTVMYEHRVLRDQMTWESDHRVLYLRNCKRHCSHAPAMQWACGDVVWYWNGQIHRDDGPAVIRSADQTQEWWQHARKHREGGPAVVVPDCCEEWWHNGKQHRIGAPAVQWLDGPYSWYVNGVLHRTDGPAVADMYGQYWWQHGKKHRADGPAVECYDGTEWWYCEGRLHRTDGPAITDIAGDKHWYIHGQRHRVDWMDPL